MILVLALASAALVPRLAEFVGTAAVIAAAEALVAMVALVRMHLLHPPGAKVMRAWGTQAAKAGTNASASARSYVEGE